MKANERFDLKLVAAFFGFIALVVWAWTIYSILTPITCVMQPCDPRLITVAYLSDGIGACIAIAFSAVTWLFYNRSSR